MIFRNMMFHWPVMAFVVIVVTLMCVADMNWPTHMGERGSMVQAVMLAAGL